MPSPLAPLPRDAFALSARAAVLSACIATAGCVESAGLGICESYGVYAVSVKVRDQTTDALIASGATLVLRDDAFVDSATVPANDPAYNGIWISTDGTMDRPGTYDVTVRRAGYADWTRSAVTVSAGRCHVRPVQLTARMVPASDVAAGPRSNDAW